MPLFPQGGGLYPDSIDNSILADMAAGTVKGRLADQGIGNPQDLTMAQLLAMLGGPNFRNLLGRNGGFEVWQRGAGGSAVFGIAASGAQYVADGWWFACGANQATTVSQTGSIALGSRYSAGFTRNAGQTGVGQYWLEYPLDSDEIALMRGLRVALSLTMIAGADFSPVNRNVYVDLVYGTGAVARRYVGAYTGETIALSMTNALTVGVANRFSATSPLVIPTNASQATVRILWTPTGTAAGADAFNIDDVQLEIGSVATPFERRPFESELGACRLHYYKTFPYTAAPVQNFGSTGMLMFPQSSTAGINGWYGPLMWPRPMRIAPTVVLYNPLVANTQIRNFITNTDFSASAVNSAFENGMSIYGTTPAGSALGQLCGIHATADAGI